MGHAANFSKCHVKKSGRENTLCNMLSNSTRKIDAAGLQGRRRRRRLQRLKSYTQNIRVCAHLSSKNFRESIKC